MRVALTQETNLSLEKTLFINNLSILLQDYFKNSNYGEGVKQVLIGIICVKPEFDFFYKERGVQYVVKRSFKNELGEKIMIENSVSFDIKLNFEMCLNLNQNQFKQLVFTEILKSMQKLDSLPKKVKNFDSWKFRVDLESFLRKVEL